MQNSSLVVLALALIFIPTSMAANPIDMVAAPLQEKLNTTASDLEKSALEHIAQGNLTQEHISQDINTTREQLKKEAMEQINQGLNTTAEQLEQRAKEELQNQVSKKVQQPGFEAIFALLGLLGIALLAGRRN